VFAIGKEESKLPHGEVLQKDLPSNFAKAATHKESSKAQGVASKKSTQDQKSKSKPKVTVADIFLQGCTHDESDPKIKEETKRREELMRSEIREPDEWPWFILEETFEGVTLKHVYENIFMFARVKHEQECPTPFCEPAWNEFHERGQNYDIKYTPIHGPKMPDCWRNWRKQTTGKDFEQFPNSVYFEADLTHKAFNPVPM